MPVPSDKAGMPAPGRQLMPTDISSSTRRESSSVEAQTHPGMQGAGAWDPCWLATRTGNTRGRRKRELRQLPARGGKQPGPISLVMRHAEGIVHSLQEAMAMVVLGIVGMPVKELCARTQQGLRATGRKLLEGRMHRQQQGSQRKQPKPKSFPHVPFEHRANTTKPGRMHPFPSAARFPRAARIPSPRALPFPSLHP